MTTVSYNKIYSYPALMSLGYTVGVIYIIIVLFQIPTSLVNVLDEIIVSTLLIVGSEYFRSMYVCFSNEVLEFSNIPKLRGRMKFRTSDIKSLAYNDTFGYAVLVTRSGSEHKFEIKRKSILRNEIEKWSQNHLSDASKN